MQEQAQPIAPPPSPKPRPRFVMPPGFIFDSDMGRNIDTVLGAAVLYSMGAKGRVVAAGVTSKSLHSAGFCEVLARFYSGETPGVMTSQAAPVGLNEEGWQLTPEASMISQPLSRTTAEGKPAFRHSIESVLDTADACVLYRNALLSQKPGHGTVVLAGPASNLAKLLRFKGAAEIVKERVGVLVAALGCYDGDRPDPRVLADIDAARTLFSTWPTPIVVVGTEVGEAVPFPGSSLDSAFSWAPLHPVVEAYRAFRRMPYDAPAQALAAALHASDRQAGLFQVSPAGTLVVTDDGHTRFSPAPDGTHHYLIVDPGHRQRIADAYVARVSAKPAPPRRRF